MPVEIDIATEFSGWERCGFTLEKTVGDAIAATLDQSPVKEIVRNRDSEVSIVLCDDDFIRNLNRDYRGKDAPTNVLSFPQADFADPDMLPGHLPFGDIVLSFQTIERESREQEKNFQSHFTHLVVHGMLHLMGHDHETPGEAAAMEALEIAILGTLGIENPYPDSGFVA